MFKTKKERLSMLTHQPCSSCRGSGKFYDDGYGVNDCPDCQGEGYVKRVPIKV